MKAALMIRPFQGCACRVTVRGEAVETRACPLHRSAQQTFEALCAAQLEFVTEKARADYFAAECEALTAERGRLALSLALAEAQLDEAQQAIARLTAQLQQLRAEVQMPLPEVAS